MRVREGNEGKERVCGCMVVCRKVGQWKEV